MIKQESFTTFYKINGHEYKVAAPAMVDTTTGKTVPNKELDDAAAEKARQQYRNDMDLISPEALKNYRNKTGFSQRNLAELMGLSTNTIVLYESGAFPTTTNNRILKALINNDEVLKQYLENDDLKYSSSLTERIKAIFE